MRAYGRIKQLKRKTTTMLKRSKFALIALLFATPLFVTAAVSGQTGTGNTTTTTTTTQPATETDSAPETVEQKTQRDNRITKMKEIQKVKLTTTDKKNILAKCKAAQGKVGSIGGRVNGIETSRTKVHVNLLNRMQGLVEKLKAKNVDTTQLEASITELTVKISTFNSDLTIYKTSITDLQALDCQASPDGFKATLLTARSNLDKVRADAKDVHTYLNETIKPLLKTLRAQVEPTTTQKPTEEQGGAQ